MRPVAAVNKVKRKRVAAVRAVVKAVKTKSANAARKHSIP
jgi:hypothetical protein